MNPIDSKKPTLLFFHAKTVATEDEKNAGIAAANAINASLRFRNGGIPIDGSLEPADFVGGVAPREYREKIAYIDGNGAISAPTQTQEGKAPADAFATGNAASLPTDAITSSLAEEIGSAPKPATPWK